MARLEGLNKALFRAGDRVCCAVSGGADSVALLLAMVEANAARESLGVVLSAIHVHHGLRGAEADGDEAFVRELCGRLEVPLAVERVDTPARQVAAGEGLEEAARELRYGAFRRLLASGSVDAIATAHTLDDQAETVVMKFLRGAWTEGLSGIQPVLALRGASGPGLQSVDSRAEAPGSVSGRVLRPLVGVRRAEIEAFLRSAGQVWREDSSNANLSLTRNRVRHELMPRLREYNPGLDELLGRMAAVARDEEEFWQMEVARILPGLLLPGKPVRGGGRAVGTGVGERAVGLEIERVRALPAALRRRVIRGAAGAVGARPNGEETAKLMALCGLEPYPGLQGRIGARLELGGGLRAERSARELRLSCNGI